jgi:hypothetical protein
MAEPDYSKFWWGFLPGILLPPLFMTIFFFVNVDTESTYSEFLIGMIKERVFPALIAVSGIINLLVFYFFLHTERWKAGRGVILATMIYVMLMLWFKFF